MATFFSLANGDWHPRPIDSVGWLEEALAGVDATEAAIRDAVTAFMGRDDVEFASVEIDDLMSAFGKALTDQKPIG